MRRIEDANTPIVLVAEDDPDLRMVVVTTLECAGCRVQTVADGESLVAALEQSPAIDLVVSDIHLGGLRGTESCQVVRDRGIEAPFIFMTAYGNDEWGEAATRLGARAVFQKPLDLDDLVEAVLTTLYGRALVPRAG